MYCRLALLWNEFIFDNVNERAMIGTAEWDSFLEVLEKTWVACSVFADFGQIAEYALGENYDCF